MQEMNIEKGFKFPAEERTPTKAILTLDEAFMLDERINSIEDLVEVTQKMNERASYDPEKQENSVIIAGQKFKRSEVEGWLVNQEFDNLEEDGRNSPDASLEADMKDYTVTRYIGLPDLVTTLQGAGMSLQDLSGEGLLEVLWDFGLNTKDYKVQEFTDTYRAMNGKAVSGLRFLCQERMDDEWLKSGMASFEAQVEAKGDASLQRELEMIGKR